METVQETTWRPQLSLVLRRWVFGRGCRQPMSRTCHGDGYTGHPCSSKHVHSSCQCCQCSSCQCQCSPRSTSHISFEGVSYPSQMVHISFGDLRHICIAYVQVRICIWVLRCLAMTLRTSYQRLLVAHRSHSLWGEWAMRGNGGSISPYMSAWYSLCCTSDSQHIFLAPPNLLHNLRLQPLHILSWNIRSTLADHWRSRLGSRGQV